MTCQMEHRHSFRLDQPGVACVSWASRTRRYAVGNLSLGGLLLLGAPAPKVGSRVDAVVRMRGIQALALRGRVLRTAGSNLRPTFAVTFTRIPTDAEDAIHDLWLAEREHPTAPTVVLVARSLRVRQLISDVLVRLGWSVAAAGTPLEAISLLDRLAEDIHWVVAFQQLTQTCGAHLLSHLGAEYPGVRRLLICPMSTTRLDRAAVRQGMAEAAVLQPVNPRDLAAVLGRGRARPGAKARDQPS